MGRIKGRHIKTAANEMVKQFSEHLSTDFEQNKAVVKEMGLLPQSKKERMKLAGQLTVLMKRRRPAAKEPNP